MVVLFTVRVELTQNTAALTPSLPEMVELLMIVGLSQAVTAPPKSPRELLLEIVLELIVNEVGRSKGVIRLEKTPPPSIFALLWGMVELVIVSNPKLTRP